MLKKRSILAGIVLALSCTLACAENSAEQVQNYLEMSKKGSIPATISLADAYQRGDGVEQDLERARTYYEVAAQAGNPMAQTILARMYDTAQGGPRDTVKMIYWLRQAAMQNTPEALYLLSDKLANGDGVPQDTRVAYNLLVRCAISPVWDGKRLNKTPVACRFFLADSDLRLAGPDDYETRTRALIFLALAFGDPHAEDVQREDDTYAEVFRVSRIEYEKDIKTLPPEYAGTLQTELSDPPALFVRIAKQLETPEILKP